VANDDGTNADFSAIPGEPPNASLAIANCDAMGLTSSGRFALSPAADGLPLLAGFGKEDEPDAAWSSLGG
jgi:hypothetical protein